MLNAHDVNTCLLMSRESKFGSFLCNLKMTCLLSIGGTISELLLLIYASPPPMWEFIYFFYPMKVKKKESRKESGLEKGRERGKKEGRKKEELPHFVFRVYVLKGCLSRFVYSSSFCVLFLP